MLDGELQVFFDKFTAKGIAVEFDLAIGLAICICTAVLSTSLPLTHVDFGI